MLNRSLTSTLDRMITLNRAFEEAFPAGQASTNGTRRVWVPALDIVEKGDAYVLYAELPGMDRSQVDIAFEKNVLTIRGSKKLALGDDAEARVYAAERVSGEFERSVRLPQYVDAERISAELVNGLLTVTVPKAQAAQPRKIALS